MLGKLILIRHGETDYNVQHLLTGWADAQLTERGIAQAVEAGKLLADIQLDKVYASTLSRAYKTADLLLSAAAEISDDNYLAGLFNANSQSWQVERRSELDELDVGRFTGRHPHHDEEIKANVRNYYTVVAGGESMEQVVEIRVRPFYQDVLLPRLAHGEAVLVVAHAGTLRAFDYVMGLKAVPERNIPEKKHRPVGNAQPSIYEYNNGILNKETIKVLGVPPTASVAPNLIA